MFLFIIKYFKKFTDLFKIDPNFKSTDTDDVLYDSKNRDKSPMDHADVTYGHTYKRL